MFRFEEPSKPEPQQSLKNGLTPCHRAHKLGIMDSAQPQLASSSQTGKSKPHPALFLDTLVCPICRKKLLIAQSFSCLNCSRVFQKSPFPIFLDEAILSTKLRDSIQHYTIVAASLEKAGTAPFASFLNYGYVANSNRRHSKIEPHAYALNKNSVRLLYEIIGEIGLSGQNVLEVGCGRGGNSATIAEEFGSKLTVGIDVCSASIKHCESVHRLGNLSFCVGDAQHLPFENETFGVVVNIESSHSYPDIRKFYNEVKRVLLPGGYFLYSDLLETKLISDNKSFLQDIGFDIIRDEDISENVLLSCAQIAAQRKAAYAGVSDDRTRRALDEFLAAPGSKINERLKQGETRYFNLALLKR